MTIKKPSKRQKQHFAPHIDARKAPPCHIYDCIEAGVYKAPKSKNDLNEYNWFCLEHIREHNKKWDYFSGMESAEIEAFMHDAVTGHRPTWSRESRLRENHISLQDKLYEFMSGQKPIPPTPRIPAKIRKSLAIMELEYPYTTANLKRKYRVLVKKYHPDVNKHDKEAEEKFKKITIAYKLLLDEQI